MIIMGHGNYSVLVEGSQLTNFLYFAWSSSSGVAYSKDNTKTQKTNYFIVFHFWIFMH